MRTYDIDLTIRIRCIANNENEATDTVMERVQRWRKALEKAGGGE